MRHVIEYWNKFYRKYNSNLEPSQFAHFIANRFPDRQIVIDVGCGSGRDSLLFASRGWSVLGIDASENAVASCRARESRFGSQCEFLTLDVECIDFEMLVSERGYSPTSMLIYARFFLHAISDQEEDAFLRTVAPLVARGALLCLEARSVDDADLPKVEAAHFRRFISPKYLENRCRSLSMQAKLLYSARGLAPYGSEDPVIVRGVFHGKRQHD